MRIPPFNVYSQFGEDAILAAVFADLDIVAGRLVEVGAWDGLHLSNCRSLLEQGWTGVHFEMDSTRSKSLQDNVAPFGSHAVCARVGPTGTPLSRLLDDIGEPEHVNFLSIDIDSDDLAVLEDFIANRAADVVCVEFNPTVPNDVYFVNTPGRTWGNSALAICALANNAAYTLVAWTACNLIFVSDLVHCDRFVRYDLTGESGPGPYRLWWGYDGTLFTSTVEQAQQSPMVQPLPRIRPPWGQPDFPQPVAADRRVWPTSSSA